VGLCRALNQRGAKYIVIGGFAMIAAGLPRMTADVDLLVAADLENEAKVFSGLATLPSRLPSSTIFRNGFIDLAGVKSGLGQIRRVG